MIEFAWWSARLAGPFGRRGGVTLEIRNRVMSRACCVARRLKHGPGLKVSMDSDIQSASDSPCRIVIIRMPKPPSPLFTPKLTAALLIAGNFVPFSVREERDAGLSSKNW